MAGWPVAHQRTACVARASIAALAPSERLSRREAASVLERIAVARSRGTAIVTLLFLLALGLGATGAQAQLPSLPPLPITLPGVPPVGVPGAPAPAAIAPYGSSNLGTFHNILPPGENGLDNGVQLLQYLQTGARPPHFSDQLGMYADLINRRPISDQQIPNYYKDATFGVSASDVESTTTPESGVTIVRDKSFGVPHIYGTTRDALMFGIGYATAQDRLFFIDVLRHYGAAQLASFAGGSNASTDAAQFEIAPYTQADLQQQIDYIRTRLPDGERIYQDGINYMAGINAYINMAKLDPNMMPGEYAALGMPQGPQPFQSTDLIRIASLVGGIFGQGGGGELQNAMLEEALRQRFGAERRSVPGSPDALPPKHAKRKPKRSAKHKARAIKARGATAGAVAPSATAASAVTPAPAVAPVGDAASAGPSTSAAVARARKPARRRRAPRRRKTAVDHSGFAVFTDFDRRDDPEAPTTVNNGRRFPYQTPPARTAAASLAMPDSGSVAPVNPVVGGAPPAVPVGPLQGLTPSAQAARARQAALLAFPRANSNALLVSGARSTSGHPIAVFGPQVAYFAPEILMEQDIHGPGIDARGAAFPGTNLYVELGHGTDYAWSATSSGQDIIDTFAVALCNPNGGGVSPQSDYYVFQGHCLPMQTLTQSESWTPNPADSTPAGSQTLKVQRTALGLVTARATIRGRPVAYTRLRSTYMHELDSAQGFEQFNTAAAMRTPQQFMNAAYQIGYTFNWFYINDKHIAYFDSGHNPVRSAGVNPLFPTWSNFPWKGLDTSTYGSAQTPQSQHPQAVDQAYMTSWNNKQAPGYSNGDTGQQYASIYRSQSLDAGINGFLAYGRKMTTGDLVSAMAGAATVDLRGAQVLRYALALVGHPRNPQLASAVNTLTTWMRSGAHRIDPSGGGHYLQSGAVQLMDAWWPLLVSADFGPTLGPALLRQVETNFPINDQPGHGVSGQHLGSAFDVGFYGVVQKDLRRALRLRVKGALSRVYCGGGSLKRCRAALQASLASATAESAAQVYPADSVCKAGDQACSDSIRFRPLGGVQQPLIPWQNRPTFQQVVEIQGHQP
jgi:acyl-homoserine lactone acylase PvdQ